MTLDRGIKKRNVRTILLEEVGGQIHQRHRSEYAEKSKILRVVHLSSQVCYVLYVTSLPPSIIWYSPTAFVRASALPCTWFLHGGPCIQAPKCVQAPCANIFHYVQLRYHRGRLQLLRGEIRTGEGIEQGRHNQCFVRTGQFRRSEFETDKTQLSISAVLLSQSWQTYYEKYTTEKNHSNTEVVIHVTVATLNLDAFWKLLAAEFLVGLSRFLFIFSCMPPVNDFC